MKLPKDTAVVAVLGEFPVILWNERWLILSLASLLNPRSRVDARDG